MYLSYHFTYDFPIKPAIWAARTINPIATAQTGYGIILNHFHGGPHGGPIGSLSIRKILNLHLQRVCQISGASRAPGGCDGPVCPGHLLWQPMAVI